MHFTNPSLKSLLSYSVFIAVLLLRPNGLFAQMTDRQILMRDLLVLFAPDRLGAGAAVLRQRVRRVDGADLPDVRGAVVELGRCSAAARATCRWRPRPSSASARTPARWRSSKLSWLAVDRARRGVAAAVAVVMGAAVLHLRGTYFAVLTFGMTELIRHAITYFEKQVTGTVGPRAHRGARARHGLPHGAGARGAGGGAVDRRAAHAASAWRWLGIGADEQRAQTLGVNTRLVKIAGFALTAAFAGAVGAAMSVRWTYIDPHTVFNPFIGFQTVLIALIGGARHAVGAADRRRRVQPAGRDAAAAGAAGVHDGARPAADPVACCTCRAAWRRCAGKPSAAGGGTRAPGAASGATSGAATRRATSGARRERRLV